MDNRPDGLNTESFLGPGKINVQKNKKKHRKRSYFPVKLIDTVLATVTVYGLNKYLDYIHTFDMT